MQAQLCLPSACSSCHRSGLVPSPSANGSSGACLSFRWLPRRGIRAVHAGTPGTARRGACSVSNQSAPTTAAVAQITHQKTRRLIGVWRFRFDAVRCCSLHVAQQQQLRVAALVIAVPCRRVCAGSVVTILFVFGPGPPAPTAPRCAVSSGDAGVSRWPCQQLSCVAPLRQQGACRRCLEQSGADLGRVALRRCSLFRIRQQRNKRVPDAPTRPCVTSHRFHRRRAVSAQHRFAGLGWSDCVELQGWAANPATAVGRVQTRSACCVCLTEVDIV